MQLVGSPCHICHDRIAIIVGAHACAECAKAWHDSCVTAARICPVCASDVESSAQKRSDSDAVAIADRARMGRLIYIGLLASYGVVAAVFLFTTSALQNNIVLFQAIARWLVFTITWFAAYSGSARARNVLGIFSVLGFIVSLFVLSDIPLMGSVILVHSAFAVWATWFSSHIRAHEQLKRPSR